MKNRSVHFTAPGFRTQLVDIAPNAEEVPSNRYPLIENEDKNLSNNIVVLDEATRNKNRIFQERLNEIWSSTSGWEARLRTEITEAEEATDHLKAEYTRHIKNFGKSIKKLINKKYDILDFEEFPQLVSHVDTIDKDMRYFVNITVPENVERQSGEVSRQLKKQHESFDIEKQKENKREKKIVLKANDHIQNSAQRLNDENALMTARFFSVEEDIIDRERRASRIHDRHFDTAADGVEHNELLLSKEKEKRRVEDEQLLDKIHETQKHLQRTIVEHFGSSSTNEL